MGMATPATEDVSGWGPVESAPMVWVYYLGTSSVGEYHGPAPSWWFRRCLACGAAYGLTSLWLHHCTTKGGA